MPGPDTRKKFAVKKVHRGTQVIFGERQHLQEVLKSVQQARLPRARKQSETRQLKSLIRARTEEMNRINPAWDRKYRKALEPATGSRELLRLALSLPRDDYLLARALTEHAQAPPEVLERLAAHPYAAARENVARHPRTPVAVLRRMADDSSEPLWFLVACNPSTPDDLRESLRARLKPIP
ncbi:MAG: hypothetical protein ACE145_14305 [Terriglobia bacterium]